MAGMHRLGIWSLIGLFVLSPMVAAAPAAPADDPDAAPLKDKSLAKAGSFFVLPAEAELADAMRNLRKLKVKVDGLTRQRTTLEAKLKMIKNAISGGEHQHTVLHEQYVAATDVAQKNQFAEKANLLLEQIKDANNMRQEVETQLNGLGAEDKSQFINQVIDLGTKVDDALAKYKELSDDPDVKQALDKVNQGARKYKLGPSSEFTTNAAQLKKWRSDVASDTIQIKHENEVPVVEVTLNGNVTREMIVDSGASMVCLTADLAKQLGLDPTEKDPTIMFKMADGKTVEAKQMVLKTVRVGQFTVADVDCAVLPASLVAAEPLLGGTFLNNFVFKVDPKAGEMHLAVIAGNSKVTTAGTKDVKKSN